jgi:hypothetical protein
MFPESSERQQSNLCSQSHWPQMGDIKAVMQAGPDLLTIGAVYDHAIHGGTARHLSSFCLLDYFSGRRQKGTPSLS